MSLLSLGQIWLIVYAVLLFGGGIMGYVKAKSQKSLMGGLVGTAVMAAAAALSYGQPPLGFGIGILGALGLTIVFVIRLRKTGAFMPAGLMTGLSAITAVVMGLALWAPPV